jgi:hypothetical protein
MTHQEADELRHRYLHLEGTSYTDTRKNQVDTITELVITPQDHPFFPEFQKFYLETGSYQKAAELSFAKHQEEIVYAVKCVLEEVYDMQKDIEMHVLTDVNYVLRFTS